MGSQRFCTSGIVGYFSNFSAVAIFVSFGLVLCFERLSNLGIGLDEVGSPFANTEYLRHAHTQTGRLKRGRQRAK